MASGRLRLDHPKWVLHLGADVSFGCFDQIIQSSLRRVWQHSPLSGAHGDAEADPPALHLVSLLNPLVTGICINHGLSAVQELSRWRQVMHMGSRGFH